MTDAARFDCEIRMDLPATLAAVEEFLVEFRRRSETLLNPENRFAAELLVREALTNAVVHGCRADSGRQVHCALRLKGNRLFIVVEDDGEGFDWRSARSTRANIADCSGRGMQILHTYANRVRFNDKGNRVAMSKRI